MQWFRLYSEFATDPKIQMMNESYQRRLVMLFCLQCNVTETLRDEEVTFQLRIAPEEWAATKEEFIRRGFIDRSNRILNWEKRQYLSDSSTQRVRKYREAKKKGVTCNVSVTPPETDTEADKEKKKETGGRVKKVTLAELSVDHIADWLSRKRSEGKYLKHDEHFILDYFKNYCQSKGKRYDDYTAGLRNAFEWDRCQPKDYPTSTVHSRGFQPTPNKDDRARAAVMRVADRLGFAPESQS